jgi:hypothetical protein
MHYCILVTIVENQNYHGTLMLSAFIRSTYFWQGVNHLLILILSDPPIKEKKITEPKIVALSSIHALFRTHANWSEL